MFDFLIDWKLKMVIWVWC